MLAEGQEISKKELGGLVATETWMNEEASTTQKKLDGIISWVLKHKPPTSDQAGVEDTGQLLKAAANRQGEHT